MSTRYTRQIRVVFFFQAEDGIRYHCVTGVQTCALPISLRVRLRRRRLPARERDGDARERGAVRAFDAARYLVPVERGGEVGRLVGGDAFEARARAVELVVRLRGRDRVVAVGGDVEGVAALRVGGRRAGLRAREREGHAREPGARGGDAAAELEGRRDGGEGLRLVGREVVVSLRGGREGVAEELRGRDRVAAPARQVGEGEVAARVGRRRRGLPAREGDRVSAQGLVRRVEHLPRDGVELRRAVEVG